ncbi:aldehyde dehydrogenase family protein [Cupriavidus basilensis]
MMPAQRERPAASSWPTWSSSTATNWASAGDAQRRQGAAGASRKAWRRAAARNGCAASGRLGRTKIEGSTLDVSVPFPPGTRYSAMTRRSPVGVVGAIVPWNFPC